MGGHFRTLSPVAKSFTETPQFAGFMKPSRFEGAVDNLEIIAEIPVEIDGTFLSSDAGPSLSANVQGRSRKSDYCTITGGGFKAAKVSRQWFNGDGNISAFSNQRWNCRLQAEICANREVR
jgi:carotenoid cleavage dioxygenase